MNKFICLLITSLLCFGCSPAFAEETEPDPAAFYDNVTVNEHSVDAIADEVMSRILEYVETDTEYTVSFQSNVAEIAMTAQTVSSWYEVDFTVPQYEAYQFKGFFADSQLTAPFILGSNELDANATIYLSYEKLPIIQFFDPLGETFEPCYADNILLPVVVAPDGYEFLGWFRDSQGSQAFSEQDEVKDDMTLYACYKYNPMITLVSDFDTFEPFRYSGELVLPDVTHPAGYVFAGWYYDESATRRYNPSDTLTSDVTLYANYVEQGTMSDFFTGLLNSFTEFFADETVQYLVAIVFLVIVFAMLKVWLKYTR